ncbi:NAD-P-binding protein [Artomyces pyxidatus]|uniref:NAD-P-binding protein n=1 Tax=Artomyces pyxidatus TaxID=48021 RepID=A0ACB8SWZ6_9AGAM|nr:NAD-P-binding protein [Artomyces pyxidatus]
MAHILDPAQLFSVAGTVAVVTGGGTGIGLMMAAALENNGATVYIVGRRLPVLEKAAKERSRYGRMFALQGDVTSRESLLGVVEVIRERHGYINLLVNNAGVAHGIMQKYEHQDIRSLQNELWNAASPRDFGMSFEANVTGVYYSTVAFLELLHNGNVRRAIAELHPVTSQVITVSSVAAFRRDDRPYSIPYTLSKVASTHMGKMFANILKDWKIRSNIIAPGIYPSEMTNGVIPDSHVARDVPLQRAGRLEDIAGLILFLASKAGGYVDGTVHITDGGRLSMFSSTY